MNQEQLLNLIVDATTNQNNDQRCQSQDNLLVIQRKNPQLFFTTCASLLANENLSVSQRQSAGTVAGRLLVFIDENSGNYYWDLLNPSQKKQVKNDLISCLISPQLMVMKSAASVMSYIAAIELPRHEWEDIVEILAQHCGSQQLNIRIASITTLGFICQQIKQSQKTINKRLCQQILGAIVLVMRQGEHNLVVASLQALEHSLLFLEQLMQEKGIRDVMIEQFTKQFQSGNNTTQVYRAFYVFAKTIAPFLSQYKQLFLDLTQAHLANRDQKSLANLQLWDVIATEYTERKASERQRIGNFSNGINFIQQVSDVIVNQIMSCFIVMNKQQEENQTLKQSAMKALTTIVEASDQKVVDTIVNSVRTVIDSTNPRHQQASILLFSTICDYPDHDYIVSLFASGFDVLFNLLKSQNPLVVTMSLVGFQRLAQCMPQVFLAHKDVIYIVQTIFDYALVDNDQVRLFSCVILENISEGFKQYPNPICNDPEILLARSVSFFHDKMFMLHQKRSDLNQRIVKVIMNIVMNSQKRDVIGDLMDYMVEEYYNVLNSQVSNKLLLLSNVITVLHTAILSHKSAIPKISTLNNICDLVTAHIKKFGIEQEGLSLLGAMATTFNKNFQSRSNVFWSNIWQAINQTEDQATFKAALHCIGDYSRMLEGTFITRATQVMEKLLDYLNQNIARQMKIDIISCIGDLMLSLQSNGQKFVDRIISTADLCFQAVYDFMKDQKQIDYTQTLKTALIQMYGCVVFAINNSTGYTSHKLFIHYGNLSTFVVRTCDPNVHPTVEYLKTCLFLVYDSAVFYHKVPQYQEQVKAIIQSNQIRNLIQKADKFKGRKDIYELLDFIQTGVRF